MNANLVQHLLPGEVLAVQVGLTRTAVLVETEAGVQCGLAATLSNPGLSRYARPSVLRAGHLHEMSAPDLACLIDSPSHTEASIGLAAINALLPRDPSLWLDLKAESYLEAQGRGRSVAVVGHFPFVEQLKSLAGRFWVLELDPHDGDLPANAAPEVIPQADLVAITATTLINHTFQGLIDLLRPDARVIVVGPSTPLSPAMFEYPVEILSGVVVTDPEAALRGIGQGISLRQLRQRGIIRYVSMKKEPVRREG